MNLAQYQQQKQENIMKKCKFIINSIIITLERIEVLWKKKEVELAFKHDAA